MKREVLRKEELDAELEKLKDWKSDQDKIEKKFAFANFAEALDFVNKVGKLAEEADHHPDISFGWGYAVISLTTHDRGGVTDVDIALADKIDLISR
jgi:4a-hydroxytetrahydrobiopterin dehydratase